MDKVYVLVQPVASGSVWYFGTFPTKEAAEAVRRRVSQDPYWSHLEVWEEGLTEDPKAWAEAHVLDAGRYWFDQPEPQEVEDVGW